MTTRTRFSRVAGVAALVVATSCGDKATTEQQDTQLNATAGCVGKIDVQVSISSNGKPSFDWSPRCGVAFLLVQTVPGFMGAMPAQLWSISAPEAAPVSPVIGYGVVPEGATLRSGPGALVPGVTYKVIVDQTVGLDASVAHGEKTFTVP